MNNFSRKYFIKYILILLITLFAVSSLLFLFLFKKQKTDYASLIMRYKQAQLNYELCTANPSEPSWKGLREIKPVVEGKKMAIFIRNFIGTSRFIEFNLNENWKISNYIFRECNDGISGDDGVACAYHIELEDIQNPEYKLSLHHDETEITMCSSEDGVWSKNIPKYDTLKTSFATLRIGKIEVEGSSGYVVCQENVSELPNVKGWLNWTEIGHFTIQVPENPEPLKIEEIKENIKTIKTIKYQPQSLNK